MRLSIMKIMVLFLKHKCGKRDSSIVPSLFFSHFILFFSFFFFFGLLFFPFSFFCKVRSLIPTCGGIIVFIILSSLGQCSNNEDHHTFIYLQLKNYNSILEQNMNLCECVRQCTGMCNESRVTCKEEL